MGYFESLSWVLEPWFDKSLAELPAAIRERVIQDFVPMPWDHLSPEQRRTRALQWDYQHDPATDYDRQYWWDFFRRYDGLQEQVRHWEAVASTTVAELIDKERQLDELRREIRRMDREARREGTKYRPPRPEPSGQDEQGRTDIEYVPYPKAMSTLVERIQATPYELAAWIFLGPQHGGLAAYRTANERRPPPRFYFKRFMGSDYLAPMMACWFAVSDIQIFTPKERFIRGSVLVEQLGARPGIRPEAYIQAKVAESRLQDLHPTCGITQASQPSDLELPPLEDGLYSQVEIEAVLRDDFGVMPAKEDMEPEAPLTPDISAWLSERARSGANARHNKPGGSREKRDRLIEVWKSGKYDSKNRCAEEECRGLNMSYGTARNILRNID